jgi:uncharacterized membrane protein YfcA
MAELDWVQYWFMFPVSIGIATTAMLSGIGGAALFIPIFVIIFPVLGPEYPLTTAAAIGSALMTEVFGFSSGFVGYYRKKLIDFHSAIPFLMVAVPVAIVGAILLATLKEQEVILKGAYALLMLVLCPVILRHTPPEKIVQPQSVGAAAVEDDRPMRSVTGRDGQTYQYRKPRLGAFGAGATSVGGFLTGLLRGHHLATGQTQPRAGGGRRGDIGLHRYRHHRLGVVYPGDRAGRGRRRQCHSVEPGGLHRAGGHYRRPDRSAPARQDSAAHDGEGNCHSVWYYRRCYGIHCIAPTGCAVNK